MLQHSQSYVQYREQAQEAIDFIYLCCHAMPALNAYIKAVEHKKVRKLPDADYFKNEPDHPRLREIKENYRKVIGNSLTISIFSYFESYVFDVIKEIISFQEKSIGQDLAEFTREKRDQSMRMEESDEFLRKHIKKLRTTPKLSKRESYSKSIKNVRGTDYQFPSQLFALFGIKQLKSGLNDFKAKDIPMLIKDLLGVELSEDEEEKFTRIRNLRNDIAHGNITQVDLRDAMQHTKFLRKLAAKVDKHICKFFFVIEEYNP